MFVRFTDDKLLFFFALTTIWEQKRKSFQHCWQGFQILLKPALENFFLTVPDRWTCGFRSQNLRLLLKRGVGYYKSCYLNWGYVRNTTSYCLKVLSVLWRARDRHATKLGRLVNFNLSGVSIFLHLKDVKRNVRLLFYFSNCCSRNYYWSLTLLDLFYVRSWFLRIFSKLESLKLESSKLETQRNRRST